MPAPTRIAFVGDVMLGRLVNRVLRDVLPQFVWGDVLPVLLGADARIANLECVLSDRGEPWPGKRFVFRSDRKNVAVLAAAHITAVSLANNHVLDFGDEALREMLESLDATGIARAGAGRDEEEARRPARFVVAGCRCAFVAVTDNEPTWQAGPDYPGTFVAPCDLDDERFASLCDLVRGETASNDVVIVSYHWGPNWGERPLPEHVRVGRALIEAGARIVYGHSPHVTRGVEFYRDGAILYSCGDFVDDYAVDEVERNDESFVFIAVIDRAAVTEVRLVPTIIVDFQARRSDPVRAARQCERMRRLCAELGTRVDWLPEGLLLRRG
ncbi:MAG: CapA family protein [Thermomicrobium sp.]|nr:CapA family protein [Thermomicrobium sp.]